MSFSFFQNVPPKGGAPAGSPNPGTPGTVATDSTSAPASSPPSMAMWLPFLILVPFLLLSFRRQKKEQQARKSLKRGDRVMTQSGLIGELIEMDDRIAKVKIAPGTNVQVLASTLSPFEVATDTTKALDDLKAAKPATADKK